MEKRHKIHKYLFNPPRSTIVSGNGSIAEPISKYIDFFIKPFVMELPSYIQDTTQVLKKIQTINNIGDCFMVTIDQIKSLLLSHHHSTSALVSEILTSVLQTVQKNNNLHMESTYLQTVQKTMCKIHIHVLRTHSVL